MIVKSKCFDDNGMLPKRYTGFSEDISPELSLKDVPDNTVSLAVVMDDLDVPFQKEFTHWIIWNIPKTDVIPEGIPAGAVLEKPINAIQGVAWGKHIYRGPKQPFFIRKEHRYVFNVYALDCMLNLKATSRKDELLDSINGHILADAKITGRYKPD